MSPISRRIRRRVVKLASTRIDALVDYLDERAKASRITERLRPIVHPNPLDTEVVVGQVIGRLEDELPAGTDWKYVESEIRDILPHYNPETHKKFRDIAYFLLDPIFDTSGCTGFFTEKPSDTENLALLPSDKGLSRVIAANHSSNIDDILVGELADSMGLGLGHFAAGANLMFLPKVEQIMKELNVVKVKRAMGGDEEKAALYKTILGRTCEVLTDGGDDFIIFPEANNRQGARTRNGTLRLPERLRVVDGILDSAKDAVMVPIAVSFSRVPEYHKLVHGRGSYAFLKHRRRPFRLQRESSNGRSPIRTLANSILTSYRDVYGRACASVGKPFSIEEFLADNPGATEPARLVAEESMRQIAKVKKVMPSHIVAEAIEGAGRISTPRLLSLIQVEIDKVIDYHRRTFDSEPNFSYEFDMGARTVMEVGLRDLELMRIVRRGQVFFKSRVLVDDRPALSYYGNMTDHRLYCPDFDDKICVIGAGQWGYTLANMIGKKFLSDQKYRRHSIVVYDTREEITEAIKNKGVHPLFFRGMEPCKAVYPKFSYKDAIIDSKAIIIATPSGQFEEVIDSVCKYASRDLDLIIATKGFSHETAEMLPVIAKNKIDKAKLGFDINTAVLSGANIASEVIQGEICSTQLASENPEHISDLRELLESPRFVVHSSTDLMGTSLAGAAKNPYATIYAAAKAFGMGENYLGAYMMAATEEIRRLGAALGADSRTFTESHAWWPDLHATAMAGRSSKFGALLGQKRPARKAAQSLADGNETVESFNSISSLHRLALREGVKMPIIEYGHQIIREDAELTKEGFEKAILQQPKDEN